MLKLDTTALTVMGATAGSANARPGSAGANGRHRGPPDSLFRGDTLNPLKIRFLVSHWLEIVSLAEASSEEAVRDLREALRYEFDHLKPGRIPCRCGELEFPPAVTGGGGSGGRSFSDIVPSIETAYKALPIAWRGRTKVWLMMLGHSEQDLYEMRQDRPKGPHGWPVKGSQSAFDRQHAERMRAELRSTGFRARPQDADPEEGESVWRRMAYELGWRPREVEPELNPEQEQAA